MIIDISKCPIQEKVNIYYQNCDLIVSTNDDIMFTYVLKEIKRLQIKGCFLYFKGKKISIDRNGTLSEYPEGLFDIKTNLLLELL